jgi:DNA-binding transcriptional ArsR family regulator
MAVLKALADENRVRVLAALGPNELCVCQIVELLELAPSTVSKHMAILKQARLVSSRKDGRWIYYRLAREDATVEAKKVMSLLSRLLSDDRQVQEDTERLTHILRMDPEKLCQKHRG